MGVVLMVVILVFAAYHRSVGDRPGTFSFRHYDLTSFIFVNFASFDQKGIHFENDLNPLLEEAFEVCGRQASCTFHLSNACDFTAFIKCNSALNVSIVNARCNLHGFNVRNHILELFFERTFDSSTHGAFG